eukprot:13961135-Alexandrium_andersonii.AAC.1
MLRDGLTISRVLEERSEDSFHPAGGANGPKHGFPGNGVKGVDGTNEQDAGTPSLDLGAEKELSLIHISEPTRLALI